MGSTEDYLESLLANAVSKNKDSKVKAGNGQNRTTVKNSSVTKRNTAFSDAESELDNLLGQYGGKEKNDSNKEGYDEEEYRQPLELEEGGKIGLDDTLPEDYLLEPEPYINEKNQELDDKLVLDSRIPSEYIENNPVNDTSVKKDEFEEKEVPNQKSVKPYVKEDTNEKVTFEEFNPSSEFESFLAGFDEDDIEKRLAAAEDVSDVKTEHYNEDADITEILSAISESGNDSMDDIGEVLRSSDENVILDKSYYEKLSKAEEEDSMDDLTEEDNDISNEDKNKKDKNKKDKNKKDNSSKKKKLFGKKSDKAAGFFDKLLKKKNNKKSDEDSLDISNEDTLDSDTLNNSLNNSLNDNTSTKSMDNSTPDDDPINKILSGDGKLDSSDNDADDAFDINSGSSSFRPGDNADIFNFTSESEEGDDTSASGTDDGNTEAGDNASFFDSMNSDGTIIEQEDGENEPEEASDKKKKKGLLGKIFDLLTEEEEEPEDNLENSNLVSEENKAILEELDAEAEKGPKGKKGKKPKKEKKPKEKKPKKPKEKKEKVKEEVDPRKKIPKKFIGMTFALAISCLIVLLLVTLMVPKMNNLSNARKSYYAKDYKDTFISMYGKNLSDSDKVLYERAKLLVLLDRKYESYETYKAMDMRMQALDALLKGVDKYQELKQRAEEYDVLTDLNNIYAKITGALAGDYGVSESEALEIIGYSPLDYTLKLQSILDGTPYVKKTDEINASYGFGTVDVPEVEENIREDNFQDLLPEEENRGDASNDTDSDNITVNDTTNEISTDNNTTNSQDNPAEIIIESEQF